MTHAEAETPQTVVELPSRRTWCMPHGLRSTDSARGTSYGAVSSQTR
ncbi:hypothetical protein [Nocardioides phosphati]|nr:hypothetical protein [Nocardioides phosphati]